MRKFNRQWTALLLSAVTVFAMSCDDNDEIAVDPNAEYDAVLEVNQSGAANPNVDVTVDANTTSEIKAKVSFTGTTDMKRLYITQNIAGAGETAYEPSENIDLKGDGSVDLEADAGNNFEYAFTLPVPAGVSTGTVVYKFWTTTGNGDFRDQTQRLAVGPGTITLKYGTGVNPNASQAPLVSYSAKILAAPLASGASTTFMSLLDGVVYRIDQGAEYAARWDFGYYYTTGASGGVAEHASLASTAYYETAFNFVNVDAIAGTTDLNHTYFAASTLTSADFDAADVAGDLTFNTPTAEKITDLEAGDIVQFVDNYGNKGLIRVVEVVGTTGSNDHIKIDVKVQR